MEKLKVALLGHVWNDDGMHFHYGLQKADGTYIRHRFWGAIQSTEHKWVASYWLSAQNAANWGLKHGYDVTPYPSNDIN